MIKFAAFSPDCESLGQGMMMFMTAITHDEFEGSLKKHGLDHVEMEKWYPQQNWLDVLNDIAASDPGNASQTFVSIGMKVIETARFPAEINNMDIYTLLSIWNNVYSTNHRGKDIGGMEYTKVSDKHIQMKIRIPFPDDLEYGVYWGIARRFLPPGTNFAVTYDEAAPRREHGGPNTIIHVKWD
ncbi:MAG: hypothetical protein HY862_17470 [Chloroflexi bacterium]|nr:hypothetical protein [Chloroflexota bacterium]